MLGGLEPLSHQRLFLDVVSKEKLNCLSITIFEHFFNIHVLSPQFWRGLEVNLWLLKCFELTVLNLAEKCNKICEHLDRPKYPVLWIISLLPKSDIILAGDFLNGCN